MTRLQPCMFMLLSMFRIRSLQISLNVEYAHRMDRLEIHKREIQSCMNNLSKSVEKLRIVFPNRGGANIEPNSRRFCRRL